MNLLARLLAIGAAVVLFVTGLTLLPVHAPEPVVAPPPPPDAAGRIPAEADVFRLSDAEVGVALDAEPRPEAQPRTLAMYRNLRAYPGAPPRIPHVLTEEEYRLNRCAGCHARGGYAARFGGYAAVTPHPELTQCLQCHLPDAMGVGVPLPDQGGNFPCGQCHVDPDRPPPSLVSLAWPASHWPALDQRALPGGPPMIPHGLQLRGNCLACHGGPWAVRELRTSHPERANCRQCHVAASDTAPAFSRPPAGDTTGTGAQP